MTAPVPMVEDGEQPIYSWLDFHADVRDLLAQLKDADITITGIFAIPRGGLTLGTVLSYALNVPLSIGHEPLLSTTTSVLAVDDSTCTGGSLVPFARHGMPCAVLVKHPQAPGIGPFFCARESDELFLYPWEAEGAPEQIPLEDIVLGGGFDGDTESE